MSNEFDPGRDKTQDKRATRSTPEALDLALKTLPKRGKDTTEWAKTVTEVAALPGAPIPPASAVESAEGIGLGMPQMMERLFDALTHYAFEYHRTVSATGDPINIERPVNQKAGDERYGSRAPASFTGRLALRDWSLLVRGLPEKIDGVIIPSEQLFNYRANPDAYAPYFVIELRASGEYARWMLGRKPVTVHQLPLFSKQLIAALVRVAKKGKVTSAFRFTTGKTAPMEAVVVPPAPASDATALPQRPRSYYEDSDPLFLALTSGSMPQVSPPDQSEWVLSESGQSESVSPSSAQSASVPQAAQPEAMSRPALSSTTPQRPSTEFHTETQPQTLRVSEALNIAHAGLAGELDAIQQAVSYAVENNDGAAAEQLVNRSAKIKDLQDRIRSLSQEWLHIKPSG